MDDPETIFRYLDSARSLGGHYSAGSKGMENPESGSIQMKNPAEWRREARKTDAQSFRREYTFGSSKGSSMGGSSMEKRTCICSHGTYSWSDQSSGIMWVGVHGMDSICVVTRTGDVDTTRLRGSLQKCYSYERTVRCFMKSIISEMEDLADTLHQIYGRRIEKPFGVVSTIPVSTIPDSKEARKKSAHKASSDDYMERMKSFHLDEFLKEASALPSSRAAAKHDEEKEHDEKKAVEFLREKTKGDLAFTVDVTIQTAISALQHLFQQEFQANEIEVFVLDPNYRVYVWEADANYKDILLKELEFHEIEEHLCVVNAPGSGSSGSSTITFESMETPESGSIQMKNPVNMPEGNTCHSGTDQCRRKWWGIYEDDEVEIDLADLSSKIAQRFNQSIKEPFGVGTNEVHKESGRKNDTTSHTAIMGLCAPNFGVVAADSRSTFMDSGAIAKNDVDKIINICSSVVMAGAGDYSFFRRVSSLVPVEVAGQPIPETMGELVEIVVRKMNQIIVQYAYDLKRTDPKTDFEVGYILLGRLNDGYKMYSISISPDRRHLVSKRETCIIFNDGSGEGRLKQYQTQNPLDDWVVEFEGVLHAFKCLEHAIRTAPGADKTCGGNIRVVLIDEKGCQKIEFRMNSKGEYDPEPYFL